MQLEQLVAVYAETLRLNLASSLPKGQWETRQAGQHEWLIGTASESDAHLPFWVRVLLDERNQVLALSLHHQTVKTRQQFPRAYAQLRQLLEEAGVDVLLHTDDSCGRFIYQRNEFPIHPTGPKSSQILEQLQGVQRELTGARLLLAPDHETIALASSYVVGGVWFLRFVHDDSAMGAGRLEINGHELEAYQEAAVIFKFPQRAIQQAVTLEQDILQAVAARDRRAYYDPATQSLNLSGRRIPFAVKVEMHDPFHAGAFGYNVRLGSYKGVHQTAAEALDAAKQAVRQLMDDNG